MRIRRRQQFSRHGPRWTQLQGSLARLQQAQTKPVPLLPFLLPCPPALLPPNLRPQWQASSISEGAPLLALEAGPGGGRIELANFTAQGCEGSWAV